MVAFWLYDESVVLLHGIIVVGHVREDFYMSPVEKHTYNTFKTKQLPAIQKLTFYCTDDLNEQYDPLTFFLNDAKKLVSVEFQVSFLDKTIHYYFETENWVSYDWESESQAMKSPNWKDYPIRLMQTEIHDVEKAEGLEVASEVLGRQNTFPDIFSYLKLAITGGEEAKSAVLALERSILTVLKS